MVKKIRSDPRLCLPALTIERCPTIKPSSDSSSLQSEPFPPRKQKRKRKK